MASIAPPETQGAPGSSPAIAGQNESDELWTAAVKLLNPDDEAQIRLQNTNKLTVLDEVLAAAIEKRERCKDRQWKIKRRDGTIIVLRDVFDRIASWLNKLQSIGDFVTQFDSAHLALPWSLIKFFLQISTVDSEKLGTVYDRIEMITNLIGRCAIFEDLYLRDSSKASDLFKKAIIKLYVSVLTYLAEAKRFYAQNSATKNILHISDFDVDKLAENIQNEQTSVEEFARLIDAESLRNANQNIRLLSTEAQKYKKELRDALANLRIDHIRDQLSDLAKGVESSKKFELLRWISKIPYSKHHESVRKDRLEGSGIWLFEQVQYMQWRRAHSSSLLWLHGIPGSGKSKLVSLLIDTWRENSINPQTEPLAYVYCARNVAEPERSEPVAIVRSILRQLSCPKPNISVQSVVLKKYHELQEEGFDPRELTLFEAKALILELLEHNRATIIIDAVDECIPERRYQLLSTIEELMKKSSCPVKIVLSSRNYEDISTLLTKLTNLKIDASNNKSDIERFVRSEVTRSIQESRLLGGRVSAQLQDKLIRTLIDGAQGMFLWVALQIQNLCNPQRMKFENDVVQELGRLPDKLVDIYSKIYAEIYSAGITSRQIADTALRWLLSAQGHLSATDFIKAVTLDNAEQIEQVSTSTLMDICGNLVVLDTELDVFRFTHLSVREFLESRPDFTPKLTHAITAEICLNTLLTRDWLLSEITWQKATLYQYATLYWAFHVEHCGQDNRKNKISDTLTHILTKDDRVAPWFAKWLLQVKSASQTLSWDDPLKEKLEQLLSYPETCLFTACTFGFSETVELLSKAIPHATKQVNIGGATGLHLASQHGHLDIVQILLDVGVDIDAKDNGMETALVRACSAGHDDIVILLLSRGADRNIQGERYGTALQAASLHGNRNIVELLLESADLDAEGGQFGTALQAASLRGHHNVVKALLDKDAEVNALGGEYTKTADLSTKESNVDGITRVVRYLLKQQNLLDNPSWEDFSPEWQHETVVQLLLDGKVDINIQSRGFGPALQAASRGGHTEVIRTLLNTGADPNGEGGAYGTALQAAAVSGNDEAVQLLLEAGAYVNTQSGMYSTALQAACRRQHEKVIQILLDYKADVNAQGGVYGSALQASARTGSTRIVKILLDRGADVNAQGGEYCTALQAASSQGFHQIVQMLLDSQADVNLRGGKYGTALQAASGAGHANVVYLLVEHDAKFDNALQIAALGGHEDIVAYLLDNGADPNGQGGTFGTALQTATAAGQDKVVQLLLNKNADANSEGNYFGTALQVAAAAGNMILVQLLLDRGADPGTIGGNFGAVSTQLLERVDFEKDDQAQDHISALVAASAGGHEEVVRMLLNAQEKFEMRSGPEMLNRSLVRASANGHLKVAQLLLDNGAEINPIQEQTPLQGACKNGHEDIVRLLLAKNADANLVNGYDFLPPLHTATQGNHETIVRMLLESGANVNEDTGDGTVLHIASYNGFENLVRVYLHKGVNFNIIGGSKTTPLLLASSAGHNAIVRILLECGADPNTTVKGRSLRYGKLVKHGTALRAAVHGGFENITQLLLNYGATVNTNVDSSSTALQVACAKGSEPLVQMLLDKGADVNIQGGTYGTALQAAAYHGFENIVRLLLDRGADVNVMCGLYSTALQAGAASGNEKVVHLLLSSGANVRREDGEPEEANPSVPSFQVPSRAKLSLEDRALAFLDSVARERGEIDKRNNLLRLLERSAIAKVPTKGKRQKGKYGTSLQAAAFAGNAEVVRMLLDNGANINVRDEHGQTPLHRAAYQGHTAIVELLLSKGADINEADQQGRTALRWVANYGYEKLLGLLSLKGAQMDIKDEMGQTAMHRAAHNGNIAIARMLIEKGLNVNAVDSEGETPLFSAVRSGKPAMVRFLLANGALVSQTDNENSTALHVAASMKHYTIIRPLLEGGANIEARDGGGDTSLHIASDTGRYEAPYLLLTAGADIEARNASGQTALHIAAFQRSTIVLTLLLVKGANIHAVDNLGRTALHIAALERYTNSIAILLDKGANIEAQDLQGRKPLYNDSSTYQDLAVEEPNLEANMSDKDYMTNLLAPGFEYMASTERHEFEYVGDFRGPTFSQAGSFSYSNLPRELSSLKGRVVDNEELDKDRHPFAYNSDIR
ncbi:hypothetical protein B7463_g8880, partial [Scytalidium lignicola]